jgi:hypothetical protein
VQEALQLVCLLQDSNNDATAAAAAAAPQRDWLLALAARCSCAVSSQMLERAKGMSAELSPLVARLAELERGAEQRATAQAAQGELRDLRWDAWQHCSEVVPLGCVCSMHGCPSMG